ncbi:DegT/DnrJ/EryC1/StrS family aminotransferase [Candidatus Woesearchaeota archaeon]|nr:DegT/DnrJ/EryC1/StrS family aminotransferase [Candidatus Woesearchaeota archaeon]
MKDKAIQLLKGYTGKGRIYLAQRGNKALQVSLRISAALGKKKCVVPDQGGWITYLQYPEQMKMELVKFPTNDGIAIPDMLSRELDESAVVIITSFAGYFAEQPMGLIYSIAKQKNALLINDASGSIGTEAAKIGDIIVGSFGEGKPVNLGYGGFIAFDNIKVEDSMFDSLTFDLGYTDRLATRLGALPDKLKMYERHRIKIIADLSGMEVIHPSRRGINCVVAFKDDAERERIINYCGKNDYSFTECPRYIRVNRDAISIEVKRLEK